MMSLTLSKHAVKRFRERIGSDFSSDSMEQFISRELSGADISYSKSDKDYYILRDITYVVSRRRVVTLYMNKQR